MAILGIAASCAFVILVVGAQSEADVEIDEADLARARAAHQTSRPSRAAAPPPVTRARAAARTVARAPARSEPEPASEPEEPEPSSDVYQPPVKIDLEGDHGLKQRMDHANRLYDSGDYEAAEESAIEILRDSPKNIRMLRIVVSTACMMGDSDKATTHYEQLPARDQRQMARRCARYGVEF